MRKILKNYFDQILNAQNRIAMKKGLLFLALLFTSFAMLGQNGGRVQAMKVAYITNRVGFTPEESEKFWPLYNQFDQKDKAIRSEYKFKGNLLTISDAEAEQFIEGNFIMEEKILNLKKQFYQDMKKFLTPRKIMLFKKAEREFNLQLVKNLRERRKNNRLNNNNDGKKD